VYGGVDMKGDGFLRGTRGMSFSLFILCKALFCVLVMFSSTLLIPFRSPD
jgi:hypothetical protein